MKSNLKGKKLKYYSSKTNFLKSHRERIKIRNEKTITFQSDRQHLSGSIHVPRKKQIGAIILCHGYFQSNRFGPANMHVEIARRLSSQGILCLRFDFRGCGESQGNFESSTYDDFISDLINSVDFLCEMYSLTRDQIGLIGHSMGANVALSTALKLGVTPYIVLIAPVVTKDLDQVRFLNKRELAELLSSGRSERKGIPVNRDFLMPILSGRALMDASVYGGKVLIIVGDQDPYLSIDESKELCTLIKEHCQISIVKNANHNFFPMNTRPLLFKEIESFVVDCQKS